MNELILLKATGLGMTDYLLGENVRDICDLCVALGGIALIMILVYLKSSFVEKGI